MVPFVTYYKANSIRCPGDMWTRIYAKFPVKTKASKTLPPEPVPDTTKFNQRASVGTWLSHLPSTTAAQTATAGEVEMPFAVSSPSMGTWSMKPRGLLTGRLGVTENQLLPSVGTWNTPLMGSEKTSSLPKYAFTRMPSVGTWLAPTALATPRPVAAAAAEAYPSSAAPAFVHAASVGSWLQGVPHQVPRPWFYQKASVQDMAPEQAAEFVSGLQDLVSEKDKEIEQLKAMLLEMKSAKA